MKPLLIFGVMLFALISHGQSNITQLEYFIDKDLGVGLNTLIDIEPNQEIDEAITVSIGNDLGLGYHKLYIRTKSAEGTWSLTTRKNLEVVEPFTEKRIVAGEYFIDTDSGYTTQTSFAIDPEATDITQEFITQIPASLEVGYHKLFGRVQDNLGKWSQTFRKNIQVIQPFENIQIMAVEYFFGSDLTFGLTNEGQLDESAEDGTWIFDVPYPAGEYNFDDVLFVRVQDQNGNWSHTTTLDEIDESLGNEALVNDLFQIYPNPVSDRLNITSNGMYHIHQLGVYDLTGREVFYSQQDSQSFDVSALSTGTYILLLNTDKGKAIYKLIKK